MVVSLSPARVRNRANTMVTPFLVSGSFSLEPNRGSPPTRLLASPLLVVGSICFRYARRWLRQGTPRGIRRSWPPFPLTHSKPACWSRSATRHAQTSETVIPVSKSTQRRARSRVAMRIAPGSFTLRGKPARIAWSKVAGDTTFGQHILLEMSEHHVMPFEGFRAMPDFAMGLEILLDRSFNRQVLTLLS